MVNNVLRNLLIAFNDCPLRFLDVSDRGVYLFKFIPVW